MAISFAGCPEKGANVLRASAARIRRVGKGGNAERARVLRDMNQSKHDEWIDAYIRAQEDGVVTVDHPLWWAVAKFFDMNEIDPEGCWAAILSIVECRPSEHVLQVLAAGPLEDLIEANGAQFIDRIESEAHKSALFKEMLNGIWKSGSDEVWARVQRARGSS